MTTHRYSTPVVSAPISPQDPFAPYPAINMEVLSTSVPLPWTEDPGHYHSSSADISQYQHHRRQNDMSTYSAGPAERWLYQDDNQHISAFGLSSVQTDGIASPLAGNLGLYNTIPSPHGSSTGSNIHSPQADSECQFDGGRQPLTPPDLVMPSPASPFFPAAGQYKLTDSGMTSHPTEPRVLSENNYVLCSDQHMITEELFSLDGSTSSEAGTVDIDPALQSHHGSPLFYGTLGSGNALSTAEGFSDCLPLPMSEVQIIGHQGLPYSHRQQNSQPPEDLAQNGVDITTQLLPGHGEACIPREHRRASRRKASLCGKIRSPIASSLGRQSKRHGHLDRKAAPTSNHNGDSRRLKEHKHTKSSCNSCNAEFHDSKALDKHVKLDHGRSFPCIFNYAGCYSTFATKNEWKRHVVTQHLALSYWLCNSVECAQITGSANRRRSASLPTLGAIFNRKDLFTQHVRRMHAPETSFKHVKGSKAEKTDERERRLQEEAHRQRCTLPTYMRCPVSHCCTEFHGSNAWDDRMEHVARHLERAATGDEEQVQFGGNSDPTLTAWAESAEVGVVRRTSMGWELCNPLKDAHLPKQQCHQIKEEMAIEEDAEGEMY